MNIKEITVINFGSIHYLQTALHSQLSIIETRHLTEVSAAIEVLLCNKTVSSLPNGWVRGDTEIKGEILLNDISYLVSAKADCSVPTNLVLRVQTADGEDSTNRYISLLSHCLEQDAIESFDGQDNTIPMRLCWYRNNEDYHPPGCLAKNSDNIATTKTFRARLAKYIKAFEPELINTHKAYRLSVNEYGRFNVYYPGIHADLCLSETEKRLFLYLCFLNIAEFWSDMESIRNLHHIEKPLLIKNFLEYLDESVEIEKLIKRTIALGRQVIIVTFICLFVPVFFFLFSLLLAYLLDLTATTSDTHIVNQLIPEGIQLLFLLPAAPLIETYYHMNNVISSYTDNINVMNILFFVPLVCGLFVCVIVYIRKLFRKNHTV